MPKSLIIFVAGVVTGALLSSYFRREGTAAPQAQTIAQSVSTELRPPVVAPKPRPRLKKSPPARAAVVAEPPPIQSGPEVCLRSVSEYLSTYPTFGDITCRCTADAAEYGTVWGSGPYTSDSSLCRAAKHAGRWREDGDRVTVYLRPGQARYEGSEENGVKSEDYGTWESSFSF